MNIFVYNEIDKMFTDALERINQYLFVWNNSENGSNNEINDDPYFIYGYSIFEGLLTECLRYLINGFPQKLDKNITLGKNELLYSELSYYVIYNVVNEYIRNFSSKTLNEYLNFFKNTADIDFDYDKETVQQISNLRNIIIHDNNRIISNSDDYNKFHYVYNKVYPNITSDDKFSNLLYLRTLLEIIYHKMTEKYGEYTKERLLRQLWSEIFNSQLLSFNTIWEIKDKKIVIGDIEKIKKIIKSISSSEKFYLYLFINQYSTVLATKLFKGIEMPPIVSISDKEKIFKFLEVFMAYPLLLSDIAFV